MLLPRTIQTRNILLSRYLTVLISSLSIKSLSHQLQRDRPKRLRLHEADEVLGGQNLIGDYIRISVPSSYRRFRMINERAVSLGQCITHNESGRRMRAVTYPSSNKMHWQPHAVFSRRTPSRPRSTYRFERFVAFWRSYHIVNK
jgi:hypothetical protein